MVRKDSGTNIANGILSAIVLVCGIVYSVLVAELLKKLVPFLTLDTTGFTANTAAISAPLWALGFAYMIPGLIGVLASLTGAKGLFITQMVFCILSLLIMGVFFVIALMALAAMSLSSYSNCVNVLGSCMCSNGLRISSSLGSDCDDLNTIASMANGSTAMIVIGWIVCFIITILGGILACSRDTQAAGTVLQPVQYGQPGVTVIHQGYAQPGYSQPGYAGQPGYASPAGHAPPGGYAGQHGYAPPGGYAMDNPAYGGHAGQPAEFSDVKHS